MGHGNPKLSAILYQINTTAFKMTERLSSILKHLTPGSSGLSQITSKNADDVVITLAIRTPLAKGFKGGFKDTELDYLVYALLKKVIEKSRIDPQLVEDICCGNVSDGKAAYKVRAAALAAGFPNTTAASTVNRFFSSGLKATQDIANQIASGNIDIGVAMGAEMMSVGGDRLEKPFHPEILENQESRDCMQPMGQTSENVGKDFNISREKQDRFAAENYQRAEAAQKAGWFDDEIVPIAAEVKDPKTGDVKKVTLTKDEGPRWGTTFEGLSKIRPAFPDFGDKSTGGNSSQVTDGAAAGLAPRIMGIGPSIAIPKLLSKYNITIDDCDIIEVNEAFASMAVYCKDVLKIPHEKMNIRGGAIALGHPLGATGARQIVTGLSEARRQKKKILLTSMCIGTGQGMAGLFVNEQL